jgi:hypothetical protein
VKCQIVSYHLPNTALLNRIPAMDIFLDEDGIDKYGGMHLRNDVVSLDSRMPWLVRSRGPA